MEDNTEIIVNGVDVSKCFHYVNNKEYSCNLSHTPFHYRHCEENPNCYFKQLQRKTTECEKLKNKLNEYERAGGILDEGEAWYGLAQRYKQALEEIEIYCNVIKQITCDFKDCNNKNDVEFIKMLLDIINKAKDGINE